MSKQPDPGNPEASVGRAVPAPEPASSATRLDEVAEPTSHVLELFSQRVARFTAEAEALGSRSRLVSNLRGLCFGGAAISGITALVRESGTLGWLSAALGIMFFVLVTVHSRVIAAEDLALRWVQVNKDALLRNSSRFKEIPENGARFSNAIHPYADDLDLFGPASLFQRICTARTHFGQQRLAAYLMNRANAAEIAARQEAARELAPQLDVRQRLEALAIAVAAPLAGSRSASDKSATLDAEPLLAWAEGPPGLSSKPSFVAVAWVSPIVVVSLVSAAWALDWHPLAWLLPLIAQALLLMSVRVHTAAVFAAVSSNQGLFLRFGPMLQVLEALEPSSQRLSELKRETQSTEQEPPSRAMREFERIVSWFELRHNGLIHPFVNGLLMWDVHCVLRLENWQRRCGKQLRQWFTALGEFEALATLAAAAHDNPDFVWPQVDEGTTHFQAIALGHPLLARDGRVTNDIDLGGAGKALLVTGSNMSGKSTLLRAVGVNAVLAMAGAPVCAQGLSMSPVAVRTSMRIRDSLDQGVSHFYAELRKLKGVVDALAGSAPVLFLLDEILHGTNSRERQIGARWVLAELLRKGAMGAVSTHDSGLCELPTPLMEHVRQVHLREIAEAGELRFDYKLHPGPVRSGNALRLMRSIGLQVPESDESV